MLKELQFHLPESDDEYKAKAQAEIPSRNLNTATSFGAYDNSISARKAANPPSTLVSDATMPVALRSTKRPAWATTATRTAMPRAAPPLRRPSKKEPLRQHPGRDGPSTFCRCTI
ncbi:hypothetical protein FHX77_001140 [Bifidobacterium commune]|uniref:hypothetical protein n=1 Tax=Bifidobacterium commune TaxID=1505727 RepID=UPI001605DF31|nr:hypothetical protein [Bifidobacterium commune]MBB2955419.1 hypothetical protein [Bifidobacterium commune]MBB2955712.1 hypothetical protein [Bifidobacterium commune]